MSDTHVSIYDGDQLLAVVCDWQVARDVVNSLAGDAGPARACSDHREWFRTPGRVTYERSGFRAVSTFGHPGEDRRRHGEACAARRRRARGLP